MACGCRRSTQPDNEGFFQSPCACRTFTIPFLASSSNTPSIALWLTLSQSMSSAIRILSVTCLSGVQDDGGRTQYCERERQSHGKKTRGFTQKSEPGSIRQGLAA